MVDRYWEEYNEGLTKLVDDGKKREVVIAKGCGHFVQFDDPKFVGEEVVRMIGKVGW